MVHSLKSELDGAQAEISFIKEKNRGLEEQIETELETKEELISKYQSVSAQFSTLRQSQAPQISNDQAEFFNEVNQVMVSNLC